MEGLQLTALQGLLHFRQTARVQHIMFAPKGIHRTRPALLQLQQQLQLNQHSKLDHYLMVQLVKKKLLMLLLLHSSEMKEKVLKEEIVVFLTI